MLYMEISNQVKQNYTKSTYQVQAHGFRSFHQDIIMVAGAVLVGYSFCDSAWVCIFFAIKQFSRTFFSWRLEQDPAVTRWLSFKGLPVDLIKLAFGALDNIHLYFMPGFRS